MIKGAVGVVRRYISSQDLYVVDIYDGPAGIEARPSRGQYGIIAPFPADTQIILHRYGSTTWIVKGEIPRPNTSGSEPPTDASDAALAALLTTAEQKELTTYRSLGKIIQAGDQFLGDANSHIHRLRSGSIMVRAGAACFRYFSARARKITDVAKLYWLSVPGVSFEAGLEDVDVTQISVDAPRPVPFFRFVHSVAPLDLAGAQRITVQSISQGGVDATVGLFLSILAEAVSGKLKVNSTVVPEGENGFTVDPTGVFLTRKLAELGFELKITDAGIELVTAELVSLLLTATGIVIRSPVTVNGPEKVVISEEASTYVRTVEGTETQVFNGVTKIKTDVATTAIVESQAAPKLTKSEVAPLNLKNFTGQVAITLEMPVGTAPPLLTIVTGDLQPVQIAAPSGINVLGPLQNNSKDVLTT